MSFLFTLNSVFILLGSVGPNFPHLDVYNSLRCSTVSLLSRSLKSIFCPKNTRCSSHSAIEHENYCTSSPEKQNGIHKILNVNMGLRAKTTFPFNKVICTIGAFSCRRLMQVFIKICYHFLVVAFVERADYNSDFFEIHKLTDFISFISCCLVTCNFYRHLAKRLILIFEV